jgi:hypothetical protein
VGAPLLRCICVVLTDRAQRIGQSDTEEAEARAVESAITSAAWAYHIDADSEALSYPSHRFALASGACER